MTDPNSVYSFEEMYRKHRGVVHGAILRTSHGSVRQQDIGDLEQEVWARVWQTMQPGSGSAYNPDAWRVGHLVALHGDPVGVLQPLRAEHP